MSEPVTETKTVHSPTVGARVCLIVAALLAIAAIYFVASPVRVIATNGRGFDCGSAINPPTSDFAKGVCGSANSIQMWRAGSAGAAALIVAVGGVLTFGTGQREVRARGNGGSRRGTSSTNPDYV